MNLTETLNSLSMITKAGVPSNMIVVGVSSYGRSFEMSTAGCWTADCTFTGPLSGANPGACTNTPGYIANYELETIIAENPSAVSLWDEDAYSNVLIYDDTQWAAYVSYPKVSVLTRFVILHPHISSSSVYMLLEYDSRQRDGKSELPKF